MAKLTAAQEKLMAKLQELGKMEWDFYGKSETQFNYKTAQALAKRGLVELEFHGNDRSHQYTLTLPKAAAAVEEELVFEEAGEEVVAPTEEAVEVLTASIIEEKQAAFKKQNDEVLQNFYIDWNEPVSFSVQEMEERIMEAAAETGPLETDVENIKVLVTGAGIVESFDEGMMALENYFNAIPDGFANVFIEMPPADKVELQPKLPGWVHPSELYLTQTFLFGMNISSHDSSAWRQARKMMQKAFLLKEMKGAN